jgi:hypothetical protein
MADFNFDPSGTLTFSGAISGAGTFEFTGTGELLLSGFPEHSSTGFDYIFEPSGTLTTSGTSNLQAALEPDVGGTLEASGEAPSSVFPMFVFSTAGGIEFSGTSVNVPAYVVTGLGTISTSGVVSIDNVPAFLHLPTGTLTLIGAASSRATAIYSATGSGSLETTGTSDPVINIVHRVRRFGPAFDPAFCRQAIYTSGDSATSRTAHHSATAQGEVLVSGAAMGSFYPTFTHTLAGALTFSGTTTPRATLHYVFVPSGTLTTSGIGGLKVSYVFKRGRCFGESFSHAFATDRIDLEGDVVQHSFSMIGQGTLATSGAATKQATYRTTGEGTIYFVRPETHELEATITAEALLVAKITIQTVMAAEQLDIGEEWQTTQLAVS